MKDARSQMTGTRSAFPISLMLPAALLMLATALPLRAGNDNRAPEAILYDDEGEIVGIHYAGPTKESGNGSKVVGTRLAGTPSASARSIPQLLLKAVSAEGLGILARTTYIQRVNTHSGLAPATPGNTIG